MHQSSWKGNSPKFDPYEKRARDCVGSQDPQRARKHRPTASDARAFPVSVFYAGPTPASGEAFRSRRFTIIEWPSATNQTATMRT